MKIGIDAKWFFEGPPSNRVVIRNLVEHILAQNKKDNFYVFLKKADKKKTFPYSYQNVKLVYVNTFTNALTNIFILPFYTRKFFLDVMLFQNFPSPFCKSVSINYIHDILYLDYPQYFTFLELIYLWPIKILTRRCDHVITISNSEKTRLIKHGFKSENKISVVYHGVNRKFRTKFSESECKRIKEKYDLPESFILYVGRLNHRKNISTLIKALNETDNMNLVIVGKTDNQHINIKKLVKTLDLKSRVIITGHLPDTEIPYLYAMAKFFCFPSYAEGFGLPPLEAMAVGTPVIVSNSTSLPEVCGDAAIYFNPESHFELKDIIIKINSDKNQYMELKQKGIERSKCFNWEDAAFKLNHVLHEVFNNNKT